MPAYLEYDLVYSEKRAVSGTVTIRILSHIRVGSVQMCST